MSGLADIAGLKAGVAAGGFYRASLQVGLGGGVLPAVSMSSLSGFGVACCLQAQQVGQRDAPPVDGFEVWFLSRFGGFVSLSLAARPLP
jgi:hypothetical protein